MQIQSAGHGSAAPWGVAILLGDKAGAVALAAVNAVEHGDEKSRPGGLAGFVGGLKDIQTLFQFQGSSLQFAEGGGHTMNQQKNPSCK